MSTVLHSDTGETGRGGFKQLMTLCAGSRLQGGREKLIEMHVIQN
jgi:hypothetical protein